MITQPRWKLDDDYAVDTDPFNWILYRRGRNKNGSPGIWKATGFYPSADLLFMSLYRQLTRTEDSESNLLKHLECCSERVQAVAAHLSDELDEVDSLQRPRQLAEEGPECEYRKFKHYIAGIPHVLKAALRQHFGQFTAKRWAS